MLDNWHNFFTAGQFIPHGHCYLWKPGLVRLHVVSDVVIAISYYSIPLTLVHLVRKRGDLPFDWVFLLFGSFIIACGTGHLMNIWTLWHPTYWLAGFLNAITAIISASVAVLLVWLIPKILALPSPDQLAIANSKLETEIKERQQARLELDRAYQQLTFHVENSPVGVVEWDSEFRVKRWSGQAEKIFGWKADEVIGKHPNEWQFIHPEDAEAVSTVMQKLLYSTEPRNVNLNRNCTKDNSIIYCQWYNSVFMDESGSLVSILSLALDITDRMRAEEELVKQERTLRTIIDHAPIWIWMTDTKGQMQFINKTFCENIGVPESRFLEVPHYWEIMGKEESANCLASDRLCWSKDVPHHSEEILPFVDGQLHNLEIIKAKIKADSGQVIGLIGLAVDVSDRKQAQLALQQSEIKFRKLAQQEELLNRLATQIRNSLDLDTILQTTVNEIRNLLQIDRCYFLWYRPEATALTNNLLSQNMNLKAISSDLEDESLSINNLIRATDNILLKPYESTIKASYWEVVNEAKEEILESYLGCYTDRQIGDWTDSLLQLKIIRINDASKLSDPEMQNFLMSFGIISYLSLPIKTQSGEIGVLVCTHHNCVRMWPDSEVEILQAVTNQLAIALDQAELYNQTRQVAFQAQAQAEQLEEALQQLQKTQTHLIQTEKMSSLGQMVAGVAHEINNPINFIHGNISYASEYALQLLHLVELYQQYYPKPVPEIQERMDNLDLEFISEDLRKLLSSMKVGTERIRSIVLSLRNFSRLDESEVKEVDIHEGLDSTLLILQNNLKEKSEELGIQVIKDYGRVPLIECHPGQLNQVFMNLIGNAIDALHNLRVNKNQEKTQSSTLNTELPTIWIRTEVINNHRIAIRIIDNGPGMTEEVRGKLFDPFFTTKEVGKGTGLGLSISYQIVVEKHGGQLYCISAPGEGAEFAIEIPVRCQNRKRLTSSATVSEVK
ncbi:MAG TPA: PAS domain S-box protein [Kamptonema sp.]|nr:PAS domain S-box protein [Kamptonema sp.]